MSRVAAWDRNLTAVLLGAGVLLICAPGASALGGPVNTGLPMISGTAQQGQTVTCSTGSWTPAPTGYAYTWQRNVATAIGGTGNTYTLTAADVNQAITCTVVASDALGSSLPAISLPITPTAPAAPLPPVETAPPAISGTAQQGQVVGCSTGTWQNSPTSYAYSWQRSGSNIAGATSSSYTLTSSDVNQAITCTVTASNAAGPSVASLPSAPIVPTALPTGPVPPVETAPPAISGTAQQGQTVSCSTGSWTGSPASYAYSWLRTGTSIPGATSSSYTLTSNDVNQAVSCEVVASNAAGPSALAAISAPIIVAGLPTPGAPIATGLPTISGTAQQGQTVSCSPGTWLNSPTSFTYAWSAPARRSPAHRARATRSAPPTSTRRSAASSWPTTP